MTIENLFESRGFGHRSVASATKADEGTVAMNNVIVISAALWAAIIWAIHLF